MPRYSESERDAFAKTVLDDGHCILPRHFSTSLLRAWQDAFPPLLERQQRSEVTNRGSARHYVTFPFTAPFAEPRFFEDDDLLGVVERLVGGDPVMCQLASDTPLEGSDYQDVHRDAPPLFPEWGMETPPFQLAVNFSLCDVTLDNGPLELVRGTHMLSKDEALARLSRGDVHLEPVLMKLGDVMVRDVRGLHRGTPNRTRVPRPMVVIGYSRRWLLRPEVSIQVPRKELDKLSERARRLLRFNPVVDELKQGVEEVYTAYAY